MADKAIADLKKKTDTISATDYYKVSNDITLLHYSPLNENVGVATRIEFQVMNYVPLPEKK